MVAEDTFSEKASPLCVVANAATHNVSRTGYSVDTYDSERISFGTSFGTVFQLYNFFKDCNVQIINNYVIKNKLPTQPLQLTKDIQFKVKGYNTEQLVIQ